MKTVVVIDIDDAIEKYSVDVFKANEDGDVMTEIMSDLSLIPLPQINIKEILKTTKRKSQAYKFGFIDGFNYYKRLVEETE